MTLSTNAAVQRPTIGLALSGGGARCYAQVGAIRALEEAGYAIDAIAANSSAAIVGAIYATCADAAHLEQVTRAIDFTTFRDLDGSSGLFGHKGVEDLLAEHAAATFEELKIPLAVPTVDIERAEMLVFSKGPLAPAVCASNAFPGLFVPVQHLGRNLMDGGIINNFPVDLIRNLTSSPVVAIDCRVSPRATLDLEGPNNGTLVGKIGALFSKGVPTVVKLLMQAYNITQDRVVQINCAMHPPDLQLVPPLPDDLDIQNFGRLDEAIEAGYRCVSDAVTAGRFGALADVA